jgi:predicted AAA+ superfamily ATPase
LLGAEKVEHINRHPLKGNLFENMIVIEALKYRFNRSKRSNLFFWRDAKGNEVDMLMEFGPDVIPIEIKSGSTISDNYFKGLRVFSSRLAQPPKAMALVYGGAEIQKRSEVSVWSPMTISEMICEFDEI